MGAPFQKLLPPGITRKYGDTLPQRNLLVLNDDENHVKDTEGRHSPDFRV